MLKFWRSSYIALFIFLNCSIAAQNANLKFQRLTIKEGLSQSSANSIIQDNFGLIWLGTQEGLNMFDGYDITHFKHQIKQTQTLSNSYILHVYEDSQQILWVATKNGGLNYKKPLSNHFFRTNQEWLNSKIIITDIIEDGEGFLWLATEKSGLFRYHHISDSIKRFNTENGLNNNSVSHLSIYKNQLMISYLGGGISSIDLTNLNLDFSSNSENITVNDFYNFNDSLLYVGTNSGVKVLIKISSVRLVKN